MDNGVIIIGAGLSGLTAAALLAKRGIKVRVIERTSSPGGSCGAFKRGGALFDWGASMLFGFGERGFNAHRFVFDCLEQSIEVVRHELLYSIDYTGRKIHFYSDINRFTDELSEIFPDEKPAIKRFYRDMKKLYDDVIADRPSYTTPDEQEPSDMLKSVLRHPRSYLKMLRYMNMSAETLLRQYFSGSEILDFFSKLTSTYCYATVAEAPAVMAAVMFVDNHVGGSYYPVGSTLFLVGRLEKAIEEHGGRLSYNQSCEKIIFRGGEPSAVLLGDGTELEADEIIYSGDVWQLYGKLIAKKYSTESAEWAEKLIPTLASVVMYAIVDESALADAEPIEMLVEQAKTIDDSEVTVYIPSIDDKTICEAGSHAVIAISPTRDNWGVDPAQYELLKQKHTERLSAILEKRFPGFERAISYVELATPKTLERLAGKHGGAVAGPKQMLNQHMLLRQHTRTQWKNLFCCGESTVMGTGTPTVTVSGIAAANAILQKHELEQYSTSTARESFVRVFKPPFDGVPYESEYDSKRLKLVETAKQCRLCLAPNCCVSEKLDVPGLMRRVSVGNFVGASRLVREAQPDTDFLEKCEKQCIQAPASVRISEIVSQLRALSQQ